MIRHSGCAATNTLLLMHSYLTDYDTYSFIVQVRWYLYLLYILYSKLNKILSEIFINKYKINKSIARSILRGYMKISIESISMCHCPTMSMCQCRCIIVNVKPTHWHWWQTTLTHRHIDTDTLHRHTDTVKPTHWHWHTTLLSGSTAERHQPRCYLWFTNVSLAAGSWVFKTTQWCENCVHKLPEVDEKGIYPCCTLIRRLPLVDGVTNF